MPLTDTLFVEQGPKRTLAWATMINSFGGGMYVTSSVVYFTHVVRFSAGQVSLGLFVGAAVGLLAGVVTGHLADRYGAREVQAAVMFFGAASMVSCLLVRSLVPFLLVSACIGVTYAAGASSKAPMIRAFGGGEPVAYRAYLRSVTNLGWAFGALAAGIGLEINTPAAYRSLILARALAYLVAGIAQLRVPRVEPTVAPPTTRRWVALHDSRYVTAALANCVITLHIAIPTFLLPLWIVGHTDAPRWIVAGTLVINTLLVVVLQVPASRGVRDSETAGQRLRWAGGALFVGLLCMALADAPSRWFAAGLLVVGMVCYTLGELWHAATQMEWTFGLAPEHAQGQYSGVFGIGQSLAEAVGPAVLTVCLIGGFAGWLAVGAGLLVVSFVAPALVERMGSRPAVAAPRAVERAAIS